MQSDVTLSTNEKDLDIKYGPLAAHDIDFKERTSELALASLKYILTDLNDIRKKYIFLGFHLNEFIRHRYYLEFGYDSMEEFCDANLGIDRSAVSRCISVFKEFSVCEKGTHKMWLDVKYKDYSYSQLCEMVSMSDAEREQIKPDMTIKQIREIKKQNVSRDVSPVAMSQQKKFNYKEFVKKKGAVLEKYIKGLDKNTSICLHVYNRDGKKLIPGLIVDLLEFGEHGLFIRLVNDGSSYFDLND